MTERPSVSMFDMEVAMLWKRYEDILERKRHRERRERREEIVRGEEQKRRRDKHEGEAAALVPG